jgi:hypothetical protein
MDKSIRVKILRVENNKITVQAFSSDDVDAIKRGVRVGQIVTQDYSFRPILGSFADLENVLIYTAKDGEDTTNLKSGTIELLTWQ